MHSGVSINLVVIAAYVLEVSNLQMTANIAVTSTSVQGMHSYALTGATILWEVTVASALRVMPRQPTGSVKVYPAFISLVK